MTSNPREWIGALLEKNVPLLWRQLDRRLVEHAIREYLVWPSRHDVRIEDIGHGGRRIEFARFLRDRIESLSRRYAALNARFRLFQEQMQLTTDESVRRSIMLALLADTGASKRRLRGDRRAFSRWMGPDAVAERVDRQRADIERELMFALDRLGRICADLAGDPSVPGSTEIWDKFALEQTLQPLFAFPGHARVRESAFICACRVLRGCPHEVTIAKATLQYIYRAALDVNQPIWLQCTALEMIAHRHPREIQGILTLRLDNTAGEHDLFFRRRAVAWCIVAGVDTAERILPRLSTDPSDYVRQGVAEALPQLPAPLAMALAPRLVADESPAVSAQGLLALLELRRSPAAADLAFSLLMNALQRLDGDTFVMRTALRVAARWSVPSSDAPPDARADARSSAIRLETFAKTDVLVLERQLGELHLNHPHTAIRRAAADARERIRADVVIPSAPASLTSLTLGAQTRLPRETGDHLQLARLLSIRAHEHFGFNLTTDPKGLRILRDYRWGTRLWRLLHELRHPSTDKRQNYSHVRGRVYPGLLHVPSGRVAEVSRTKVPGEPLHLSEEGGWRPWLPLLDQILSALDQAWPSRPLRIVTAEGVTHVHVPDHLFARIRAKWIISRDFARLAALRNWTPESPFEPKAYLAELAGLGIHCRFSPHTGLDGAADSVDPRLERFFTSAAAFPSLPVLAEQSREYFSTAYQNTIGQLVVFALALSVWFFGQHLSLNWKFRYARKRIPLVAGGWGTRGKSGTERLKAGVLAGLGVAVVSKTTGCEAMFLYGRANRPLSEMFLFRPYDKATIWEQANLTRLAAALGADAYLWECMGLNPRYVRILQQRWMRDDVSTITNCFPDHEDIQGPAGVDLPLVISEFVPTRGLLFTSEENMRPYLEAAAHDRQTPCEHIDWLDAGLLTQDILDRFPYQEHPYNIALVARMYERMGIERDVALKEMADHVVPDLGVLKIYPEVAVDARSIEFINGMSANERHGTISNWLRTGMDRHALDADPEIWICTVVNNRADRVARSQVFAAILVNDIGADRHFLIGGNLDGLHRFIRESYDEFMAKFDWDDAARDRGAMLDGLLRRWRIPRNPGEAGARLRAACRGLGVESSVESAVADDDALLSALAATESSRAYADAIRARYAQDTREAARVAELAAWLSDSGSTQQRMHEALWELFSARIHTVRDYYTKGNALIREIVQDAPPGLRIRCMGIQNIKGTGLDFVYRWQAWDRHARLSTQMLSDQQDVAVAAVRRLANSPELGILEQEHLRRAIALARDAVAAQTDEYQAELHQLERNLEASFAKLFSVAEKNVESRWRRALMPILEKWLDGIDGIRRRRQADRIYKDLVAHRISSARAVILLQALTQRQKGGWLV